MKKNTLKRSLAALAAAAAALAAVSGCGKNEPAQKPAESTTTAASETQAPVKVTLPPKSTTASETKNVLDSIVPEQLDVGAEIDCKPAMWKATSPSGHEMLMMGSMHALNDSCYPLPDYVMNAYESCDILAVECDITDMLSGAGVQLKYSDKMTYPEGETIEDHLSAETWENLTGYLAKYNIKPEKYEKTAAWAIYSAIQTYSLENTGLKADKGIDRFLLDSAKKDGKEIYEVESVDSQLTMLMEFPDTTYELLLSGYTAENADALSDQNVQLFKAWKSGDVEWVANAVSADTAKVGGEQQEALEEFNNAMYTERNAHMAKDAEELIEGDKTVFFVVGLAHYLGDDGIIALLEKDGFTVERVDKAA